MEYAEGGIVKGGADLPTFLTRGCTYVIPAKLAARYAQLLKELNEGLDKTDEDGVE